MFLTPLRARMQRSDRLTMKVRAEGAPCHPLPLGEGRGEGNGHGDSCFHFSGWRESPCPLVGISRDGADHDEAKRSALPNGTIDPSLLFAQFLHRPFNMRAYSVDSGKVRRFLSKNLPPRLSFRPFRRCAAGCIAPLCVRRRALKTDENPARSGRSFSGNRLNGQTV